MIPGREEQFPYSSEEIGVVPYNLALAQSRGYESRIAELAEVITEFTSGYMMGSYKSVGADIISSIGAADFIAEGIDGVIEGIKDRVVYRLSGGGFGTGEGGSRAGDFPFSGIAAGEGEEDISVPNPPMLGEEAIAVEEGGLSNVNAGLSIV